MKRENKTNAREPVSGGGKTFIAVLVITALAFIVGLPLFVFFVLKGLEAPDKQPATADAAPQATEKTGRGKKFFRKSPILVPAFLKMRDSYGGPQGGFAPLRLFDDDPELKKGDFKVSVTVEIPAGDDDPGELRVYLGHDPTDGIVFTGIRRRKVFLAAREPGVSGGAAILAQSLPGDFLRAGCDSVFVIRARGDLLEVDFTVLTGGKPLENSLEAPLRKVLVYNRRLPFNGVTAGQAESAAVSFRAAFAEDISDICFRDDFMRHAESGGWLPVSGYWVLESMAFPNRSSNPFSLKVEFQPPARGEMLGYLYAGRRERKNYGAGFSMDRVGPYPQVARITGDGPAARAGLREDDLILAVDGRDTAGGRGWLKRMFQYRKPYTLTVLRPTEKSARTIRFTPGSFRWGTPDVEFPLQPAILASPALILAPVHEARSFRFQVSVKPSAGAVGLVAGWRDPARYFVLLLRDRLEIIEFSPAAPDGERKWSSDTLRYRPGEYYRLGWERSSKKGIKVFLDGCLLADLPELDIPAGRFGLFAKKIERPDVKGIPALPDFFDDVSIDSGKYLAAEADTDAADYGGRSAKVQRPHEIFSAELDMQYWANPATEWEADFDSGWLTCSRSFPGLQTVNIFNPAGDKLAIDLHAAADSEDPADLVIDRLKAEIRCPKSGKSLVTDPVLKTGRPLASLKLEEMPARDGGWDVSVATDSRELARFRLKNNDLLGNGNGVRIRGLENWQAPGVLAVTSSRLLEYNFDTAPSDWAVISGRWGTMNKWVCDPRWSWFGGRCDSGAAFISSKAEFSGDVSIEYYAALMMRSQDAPYETLGDFNCGIMGNGKTPASGYALVVGGDINRFTALYRNGVEVARTEAPEAMLPNDRIRHWPKPELHQHWFRIKLEKTGARLAASFEGKEILSWTDPAPLESGRVGLWTVRNGFLVSKVRITFDAMKQTAPDDNPCRDFSDDYITNVIDADHATTAVTRLGTEKIPSAPETPAAPAPVPHNNQGYRVISPYGGGTLALKWKQTVLPNRAGLLVFDYRILPGASVDLYLFPLRHPWRLRLKMTGSSRPARGSFDIGEIPGAKADGKWRHAEVNLAEHLREFLEDWNKPGADWGACNVVFGNFSNTGYALAGFGQVNPPGSGCEFAAVHFVPVDGMNINGEPVMPALVDVTWPFDDDGDGVNALFRFCLPEKPAPNRRPPVFSMTSSGDSGDRSLHNEWRLVSNGNGRYAEARVRMLERLSEISGLAAMKRTREQAAMKVKENEEEKNAPEIQPDAGDRRPAGGEGEDKGAGENPAEQPDAAAAKDISEDAAEQVSEKPFKGVPVVSWRFPPGKDAAGKIELPGGYAAENDHSAPVILFAGVCRREEPEFFKLRRLIEESGADDTDEITDYIAKMFPGRRSFEFNSMADIAAVDPLRGGSHSMFNPKNPEYASLQGTRLRIEKAAAGTVKENEGNNNSVLGIYNRWEGSQFGMEFFQGNILSLDAYPRLELRMRVPKDTPMNLMMDVSGINRQACIYFNDIYDHETYYSMYSRVYLGRFQPFRDDDRWHSYSVPLLDMVRPELSGRVDNVVASNFVIGDLGWLGNRQGMRWWLDYIRAVPAGRPDQLGFAFAARDTSGRVNYLTAFDTNPDTEPVKAIVRQGETVEELFDRMVWEKNLEGVFYFHLAAVDMQGNRSVTVHRQCIVDGRPPRIRPLFPLPGGVSGTGEIYIAAKDESRVVMDSATVSFNGETGFISRVRPGVFILKPRRLPSKAPTDKKGKAADTADFPVTVTLSGAADTHGNALDVPWKYRFDYNPSPGDGVSAEVVKLWWGKADFTNPGTTSDAVRVLWDFSNNFEQGLGQSHYKLSGTRVKRVNDPAGAAWGQYFVRCTALADGGDFGVFLQKDYFPLDTRRMLSFDYRVSAGVELDLEFHVNGERFVVPFTRSSGGDSTAEESGEEKPRGARENAVGWMSPIIADGKWHKAVIDLYSVAVPRLPEDIPFRVGGWVMLRDTGRRANRRGASIEIDNYALVPGEGVSAETANRGPRFVSVAGRSYIIAAVAETNMNETVTRFRYLLDDSPAAEPDGRSSFTSAGLIDAGLDNRFVKRVWEGYIPFSPFSGKRWLHIRPEISGGRFGRTRHFRLLR